MNNEYIGRGFARGSFGYPTYEGIDRPKVERLLRSWFVWLRDGSRVHLRPHGSDLEAEFQIRRWKTREDLVVFRWRNSASTRAVFEQVRAAFHDEGRSLDLELTPRSGKPRAIVLGTRAGDVLTPSWAVGLAIRAFGHAGMEATETFDLSCRAKVLSKRVALEPESQAGVAGFKVGATIGRVVRRITRG